MCIIYVLIPIAGESVLHQLAPFTIPSGPKETTVTNRIYFYNRRLQLQQPSRQKIAYSILIISNNQLHLHLHGLKKSSKTKN